MKNAVVIWVWLCAYLNGAGWFLSAVHQLNAAGYLASLAGGIAVFFIGKNFFLSPSPQTGASCLHKLTRRLRKPFPLAFAVLSLMAFLGGAIYAPNNYDGLAYRLPRVLHWLAAGQWHWIHTFFPRVNTRACGMEWVSTPLMAIFRTDRLLFLINIISFLLLPGLIYSVLTRLGVGRRVAWHWMWLAPTGYCYLLQAGSIANDAFGVPFALAAVDLALRAKTSKQPRDLFGSVLAAALMASAKTSALPLLLPWAIAVLPSLKLFLQRPMATAAVCVMALFASSLPTVALNEHFCHDWSGVKSEDDQPHGSVVLRTAANIGLAAVLNLSPPVFPEANQWNRFVQKVLPVDLNLRLHQTLTEPEAAEFQATELQIEEDAGLGLGITVLLLASAVVAAMHGGKPRSHPGEGLWQAGLVITPWVSTLALLSQSEVYPIGRILAPFYPFLLPLLLAPPWHGQLVKKLPWRVAAYVVFVVAAGLLIISPARPLFPAETILAKIAGDYPDSKLLARVEAVYSVYHDRSEAFAPALRLLPPDVKTVGFITYDDPEAALWVPYGSRRVIHVCPGDSTAYLKARGIEYVLAKGEIFGKQFPALDDWLKTVNARVVQKIELDLRAASGPADWYFIQLN